MLKPTYSIKNNQDWAELSEGEQLVEINNDAYFGFRAMEKNAVAIIYDPYLIDSLVRVTKEAKKYKDTTHTLILDIMTMGHESSESEEEFLKAASRKIEEIKEINSELSMNFDIQCGNLNKEHIEDILDKLYK